MDPMLEKMCEHYCRRSLIITRNEESQGVLSKLGVPTELGTDTAWTFEPHPAEYGCKALSAAGWDGRTPVLALCPINPFWWPVKPSVSKLVARKCFGAYKDSHYSSVYFHNAGPAVDTAYKNYLGAIAGAVNAFREKHDVFPILVAMERLDARACKALAPQLGGVPVFTSDTHDMYELVSILRSCKLLISSRYHAMVTSMPGLVPSAGITLAPAIRGQLGMPRQPLEWKSGRRVSLYGNIFDGAWVEGTPASVFVAFTSVNGQGISDVDVQHNTFKHGPGITYVPTLGDGGDVRRWKETLGRGRACERLRRGAGVGGWRCAIPRGVPCRGWTGGGVRRGYLRNGYRRRAAGQVDP